MGKILAKQLGFRYYDSELIRFFMIFLRGMPDR
ncbi:MAG: hypothetical protein KH026_09200 [Clostridium sp.]|nr:hypothetical protein [Clostridium sp.]